MYTTHADDAGNFPVLLVSIHFMWVPEFFGTMAYVTKHPEARGCNAAGDNRRRSSPYRPYRAGDPGILFNLNLDMVGEDTVKTNSRFYITNTPDSVHGYSNGVMEDVLQQTREARLYASQREQKLLAGKKGPLYGGRDHDVFLGLGISSTMLGPRSRLDPPQQRRHRRQNRRVRVFAGVGVLAAASSAYWLANGTPENLQRHCGRVAREIIAYRSRRVGESSRPRHEQHAFAV